MLAAIRLLLFHTNETYKIDFVFAGWLGCSNLDLVRWQRMTVTTERIDMTAVAKIIRTTPHTGTDIERDLAKMKKGTFVDVVVVIITGLCDGNVVVGRCDGDIVGFDEGSVVGVIDELKGDTVGFDEASVVGGSVELSP